MRERSTSPPTGLRLALRVLEDFLIGQRPPEPRSRPNPPRAPRTSLKWIEVSEDGVTWRSRRGGGRIKARDIARLALIETVYADTTVMGTVMLYALVIDHSGAVTLRVAAGHVAGPKGVRSKHALRGIWAPLDVPIARETRGAARPKDYRRRWPEAFGFVHARPFLTIGLVAAAWMLLVAPVLDRVLGS